MVSKSLNMNLVWSHGRRKKKKQSAGAEWTELGDLLSICGWGWVVRCLEVLARDFITVMNPGPHSKQGVVQY